MPFIEQEKKIPEAELKVKIEEPVCQLLDQYCKFLNSPKSYVVQEILRKVLAKDKDFQSSLGTAKPKNAKKLQPQKAVA